ncbi:MAG: arginine--tRNA ligase [Desulfobacterales bacterium]
MKETLKQMIAAAALKAHESSLLPSGDLPEVEIEEPKADAHGDFSTNLAMTMAKAQKMAPRRIAESILQHLDDPGGVIEKTDVAGPGFINFYLKPSAWLPVLHAVHREGMKYGSSRMGEGKKVQVEFVSANPTGPLHVGHGRGAAVGDTVARLLSFCGYEVQKEYYINDSGRQIRTLGLSVFERYRELHGETVEFPPDGYQGDYIIDLAREVTDVRGRSLLEMPAEEAVDACARHAAGRILDGIRQDLLEFGVEYDRWFSEQSLYDSGRVENTIDRLKADGIVYEKDGALWFNTTAHGDEKDRVVVRANGLTTYFASDIAYHMEKFERGFDWVIDVWGADHHGYVPRMKASIAASGTNPEQFQVILVQFVNLLRGGAPVAMSTRAGEFVTLSDVVKEVGRDAARFIFLTRSTDSPLDFDLDVAKRQSNDNPVYYVQYVHARISSILRKAAENGFGDAVWTDDLQDALSGADDIQLIKAMARYPAIVRNSAQWTEPHRITYYLMDLAASFHSYYNRQRVISEDPRLSRARLYLVAAVRNIIRNGLNLLGVSAPDEM